jgi:hypothetical protein
MNTTGRENQMIQGMKFLTVVIAGLLLAGCGETENKAAKPEVVQGLRLQKMQLKSVPDELEAPGSVIAAATAQIEGRRHGPVRATACATG